MQGVSLYWSCNISKSVSRVLSWIAIYLEYILLYISSHLGERRRAALTFRLRCCSKWGLHKFYVTIELSELLPHFFTLTFKKAVIFCCTFLKVSFTGRYPALLLCGARTFLMYNFAVYTRDYPIYSIYYFKLY